MGFVRVFATVVSLLVLALPASAASNVNVQDWLSRMQQAAIVQNYTGTFVLSRGAMSSTLRVVHAYQNGMEIERLTQLDGAMGEIIRRGGEVMCVFPDNRVVQLEKDSFTNSVVQAFANFMPDSRYYTLHGGPETRLVERRAMPIVVAARDAHRYSYHLWLDVETGLLLKSSVKNTQGEALEQFRFTEIRFLEVIAAEALMPENLDQATTHEMIPPMPVDHRWPDNMMWQVNYVPPGYAAINDDRKPGDNVMLFSDGLASYSVFVEQVAQDMMPQGASMVGATVAYADKLVNGGHHYAVTVVGQIPAMTAMKVAESVRPQAP